MILGPVKLFAAGLVLLAIIGRLINTCAVIIVSCARPQLIVTTLVFFGVRRFAAEVAVCSFETEFVGFVHDLAHKILPILAHSFNYSIFLISFSLNEFVLEGTSSNFQVIAFLTITSFSIVVCSTVRSSEFQCAIFHVQVWNFREHVSFDFGTVRDYNC